MRPAAGRWRERTAAWRGDRGRTAATVSGDDDPGTNDGTTRLAQRQRFGRTQDLPRWRPGERGRILTPLQRRELATQAAIAIVMVIVVLGLLAYALFTDPGLS
jgi:hypothetical protein